MADETDTLRADYEKLLGKKPFNGWNADELKKRIAAAQSPPPVPTQEVADEIHVEATAVEEPKKAKKPALTSDDPYPTQADLDAMRAGTFDRYKTR